MNPAPTLVNDWLTLPFVAFAVAAFVAVSIGVWLGRVIREDRLRAMDLAEMDEQVQTERHCAQFSHNMRKVPVPTVWRCTVCGEEWESMPGWVGESA